jgi:hypothetical protein
VEVLLFFKKLHLYAVYYLDYYTLLYAFMRIETSLDFRITGFVDSIHNLEF